MQSITLNEGQEKAAKQIFKFLMSDDLEFSISGPAGTGKTTLMKYVSDVLLPDYKNAQRLMGERYVDYDVAYTATTNKAAEVLTRATGEDTQTIHSFLSLRVYDDYKTGKSVIKPTGAFKVFSNTLIFIDEASMIDRALYDYLMKATDPTCKIIYLGDHCQMAPVFEDISPVYRNPVHTALLTEPMRNAGQPALVALCEALRHTVETKQFFHIDSVPGVIDYLEPNDAQQFIDDQFKVENEDIRILAYTNRRVKSYLSHIRALRGYPDTYTKGEHLISNSAMMFGNKPGLRVEERLLVDEVLSGIYPFEVSSGVLLDVYELQIQRQNKATIHLKIPADPAHFNELMRYFSRQKNWERFYFLKNNFPDLRPRDACTVYKSQGSTYESVFMDLSNIGSCTNADQLARMLYVGASRARSNLYLFGQLPERLMNQST